MIFPQASGQSLSSNHTDTTAESMNLSGINELSRIDARIQSEPDAKRGKDDSPSLASRRARIEFASLSIGSFCDGILSALVTVVVSDGTSGFHHSRFQAVSNINRKAAIFAARSCPTSTYIDAHLRRFRGACHNGKWKVLSWKARESIFAMAYVGRIEFGIKSLQRHDDRSNH